ncbi:hypothetical protein [Thiomonas sp. FB-Cd]|uniref:hypothetical protein n=1 Tax=Thiomonas sp. FB-Cd TaxID=1158292 RepID=UPI0004DF64ED|nr:hypothetical protein [Thiomonas sp. FB-Cd]
MNARVALHTEQHHEPPTQIIASSDTFGQTVYVYTSAQAIEDGLLVSGSKPTREAGFACRVPMTHCSAADYTVPCDAIKRGKSTPSGMSPGYCMAG